MGRREYDQPCSLASALDKVGERWSLLIVRELTLGPLRFSELARLAGGPPSDVLTKRLRELEEAGVVRRFELEPPQSATAYELTPLGRGLERPLLELGRWGLNFHDPATVAEMEPSMLPNALRVTLLPPADAELVLGLRTGGREYRLAIAAGWIDASRGGAEDADVVLEGTPFEVMATLLGYDGSEGAKVEGDRDALGQLRAMVALPDEHRAGAMDEIASLAT
ncbi:MAG TPA: winged helix-turn-helix transcriptional regulator [Solirubrobacterales bacterium]